MTRLQGRRIKTKRIETGFIPLVSRPCRPKRLGRANFAETLSNSFER